MASNRLTDQPTSPQHMIAAERRSRVLTLRLRDASLRCIASKLGCSHETVRLDLQHALKQLHESEKEKMEHLRSFELARLDVAVNAIAEKVADGNLNAVEKWVRLSERRSKLLGLDAPLESKLNLSGNVLGEMTNEDLQRIVAARQDSARCNDRAGDGADVC